MSKKEQIQIVITGILIVVMIFAFGNAAKVTRQQNLKKVKPVAAAASVRGAPSRDIESSNLYDTLETISSRIELKRDPFTAAPIVPDKGLASEVILTGILWDPHKPLAIINGNIVKKGERSGDKTVVDIRRDRIILSDGESLSELKLAR